MRPPLLPKLLSRATGAPYKELNLFLSGFNRAPSPDLLTVRTAVENRTLSTSDLESDRLPQPLLYDHFITTTTTKSSNAPPPATATGNTHLGNSAWL